MLSVLLRFTDSDYLPLVSSNSSCNGIGGVMVSVLASSPVDRALLFQLATIINIKLSVYNADIIII